MCPDAVTGKEVFDPNEAVLADPLFINGLEDTLTSSDPLLDSINADSSKLQYKLQNAKLTGMKYYYYTTIE